MQYAEARRRRSVNANDVMRAMIETSGKSGRQVAREIGRSESFVSSTLAQGVCPRADTLARVADACGYKIVIVPKDVARNLLDGSDRIVVEYDGK
jgi:DNA-binding phage protein